MSHDPLTPYRVEDPWPCLIFVFCTYYKQTSGIGGGIFSILPLAENFSKIPLLLEILRQSDILFRKSRKNGEISLNLTRFSLN